MFYASLHGGVVPDIGYLEETSGLWNYWSRTGAPFEIAMEGTFLTAEAKYWPATAAVNRTTDGLWIEGWAGNSGGDPNKEKSVRYTLAYRTESSYRYITLHADFQSGVFTASHGASIDPLDNQRVYWGAVSGEGTYHFGWWLRWSSTGVPTITPTVTRNGTEFWSGADQALSTSTSPPGQLSRIYLRLSNIRAEALQISQLTVKPATDAERTLAGTWVKGAHLGAPEFPMLAFPKVSGDAWSVIQAMAKSTLATAEFDRDGYFRWRSHTRWSTVPKKADVTVSSTREIGSLTVTDEIDACRNEIAVRWEEWAGFDYELMRISDTPANAISIAAGGTLTRKMPIGDDQYDPQVPWVGSDATGYGNLIVSTSFFSPSSLVFGAAEHSLQRDGGTVYLMIRNRSANPIFYHGFNAAAVRASPDTKAPVAALTTARDRASQLDYGVQSYEHDGTPWIQHQPSAAKIASALVAAAADPAPGLQNLEILADPRIELGDVVRVVDTSGAELDTLAWVVGIRTEGSGTNVRQTLILRGAQSPDSPMDYELTPDPPVRPGAPPPA
ncbi:hypothetical protein [Streptomyces laurentii]|uniref:hypothetical protein n=1 Tax=Streptomyces laurentii TaxID=39478 RepID=UPI0033C77059